MKKKFFYCIFTFNYYQTKYFSTPVTSSHHTSINNIRADGHLFFTLYLQATLLILH